MIDQKAEVTWKAVCQIRRAVNRLEKAGVSGQELNPLKFANNRLVDVVIKELYNNEQAV